MFFLNGAQKRANRKNLGMSFMFGPLGWWQMKVVLRHRRVQGRHLRQAQRPYHRHGKCRHCGVGRVRGRQGKCPSSGVSWCVWSRNMGFRVLGLVQYIKKLNWARNSLCVKQAQTHIEGEIFLESQKTSTYAHNFNNIFFVNLSWNPRTVTWEYDWMTTSERSIWWWKVCSSTVRSEDLKAWFFSASLMSLLAASLPSSLSIEATKVGGSLAIMLGKWSKTLLRKQIVSKDSSNI